jgi:hypothetical protein
MQGHYDPKKALPMADGYLMAIGMVDRVTCT